MSNFKNKIHLLQDEKYEHINNTEMEKVRKCLQEKHDWFNRHMNDQANRPLTDDPVVLASQLRSEQKV